MHRRAIRVFTKKNTSFASIQQLSMKTGSIFGRLNIFCKIRLEFFLFLHKMLVFALWSRKTSFSYFSRIYLGYFWYSYQPRGHFYQCIANMYAFLKFFRTNSISTSPILYISSYFCRWAAFLLPRVVRLRKDFFLVVLDQKGKNWIHSLFAFFWK